MADLWEGAEAPASEGGAAEAAGLSDAEGDFAELAADAPAGKDRASALIRQAELAAQEPDGAERAVLLQRRALVNDPTHPAALKALLEHAASSENWVLLSMLQQRRFETASAGAERAEIARGIARIERQELHNPGVARQWLLRGIDEAPDHTPIHEALIDLERDRGDERALLQRIEDVLRLRREEAPLPLLLEAATRLGNRGERHRALSLLERASSQAPEDPEVLEALIGQLRALSHYPELADALERSAALAEGDARRQSALLAELGELLETRLFDPESALDAHQRALAAFPGSPGLVESVERLRGKLDGSQPPDAVDVHRGAEALAAYEREAAATHDRERLGVLAREIERLHGQRGTPERAIPAVQRWVRSAPEDPSALRTLARLHERAGHVEALIEVLQRLDRLLEPDAQVVQRRRIAALCVELDQLADAERFYSRALRVDPTDLASLEGRVEVLRRQDDRSDSLLEALEALSDQQSQTARFRTQIEIAEMRAAGGDLGAAIAGLEALEAEGDASAEIPERLDDLLQRSGRVEDLAERLEQRSANFDPASAEAVALNLRRAKLLLEELDRPDEAAGLYRRALEHAPEASEAVAGLERAMRSSVDASGLADFLADQMEFAADDEERDRLALERAVLLEEMLDQPEEALEAFSELAVGSAEEDVRLDSARRAEALLEQLGRWAELRDHLATRLEGCSEAEEVPLRERLANLCSGRLDDDDAALQHLERVVELQPDRADIWQVLAGRFEVEGRTADWARALEAELACGPDPARELGLRSRLSDLYAGLLQMPERLGAHYERIFELNPSHSAAAQYLIDGHEREGRHEDVIAVLEARLAHTDAGAHEDPLLRERRTSLWLQIAAVRESRLDDVEGAISALEVALEEVGPEPQVTEPLATAYRRAGYDSDLIELCSRAAAAASESPERANWLVRLGDAHLAREEAQEAADAYRRALTERPGDRAVGASLRELYRALGRKQALVELLEAELEHLAGAAEIPVRLELVQLQREGDPEAALRHARRILELAPRHADAYDAALALCPRPEEKLEILEQRLRVARSAGERIAAALERARLLDRPLGRPEESIEAYRELLAGGPGGARSREIRSELAGLLEREQRHAEWLDVWAGLCRDAPRQQRAEMIECGVGIAWDRLSPEAALPWLQRLRVECPDDPQVLGRLSHAQRQLGREAALLRALAEEAAASPDPAHARRCHLERAQLLRASGQGGRALAALEEAGPTPDVLQLRADIEHELGLHARRAATLEALLASPGSDPDLHRELAELCDGPLGDPDRARRHWQAALEASPSEAARIEGLRSLAATERQLGHLDQWARCSEDELSCLDAAPVFDDRRRELRRELALAYHEGLSQPDRALAHLRSLLDGDDVEEFCSEDRDRLERICLDLLRAAGDSVELERRLSTRLERAGGTAEDWLELARLREETLRRIDAARQAQRRALEIDPAHPGALRGLRRTCQQLGDWRGVAEALEAEIERADSDVERGALLRALADIAWHRLGSTTRASRCYAAALEANASDFAALRALERLLEAMEDWRGAIDLYESEIEVLGEANPRRRREIWLRVASLAEERADEPERARRALEQASEIGPLDTERLRDLADLCEACGDQEAFVTSFGAWCDAVDSSAGAGDQLRLAEVLEELGRTDDALSRVELAIGADPEHAGAWEAAARLRAAGGDARASAEAMRRAAEHLEPDQAASRLLQAASRLDADDPAALDLLRAATERAPQHGEALAALAVAAARQGDAETAERAAIAVLENDPGRRLEAPAAAAIAVAGADAALRRGRPEVAADLYREALDREPDHAGALAGQARILIELGDFAAARGALERRLAHPEADPDQALHRALLGRCLEHLGEPEAARHEYEAALQLDPLQVESLEACARILEQRGKFEAGVAAIERWARAAPDGAARAERLWRAARWSLRVPEHRDSAERRLRSVLAADPSFLKARLALAELQLAEGRLDETVETCDRGASRTDDPRALAALVEYQGRALEKRGERRDAAERFAMAREWDPRRSSATLAEARLLRGFGEWREAAQVLASFGENHPDRADADLADVFEQLGRLRAGPLEDLAAAVLSYRRAIELAPERHEARAALAELLSHRPGDWEEALSHLRRVLEAEPTHAGCLRVALRIARGRSDPALVATGVAIQRALGIASSYDRDEDASQAAPVISREPVLDDPDAETLRELAVEASRELARALGGTEEPGEEVAPEDEAGALRARMLALQGTLSAPALLAAPTESAGEALKLLAVLLLDPDQVSGDGHLVNTLAGALSRRRRRKLRRILPDDAVASDYANLDFEAWRTELRALAAAELLRREEAPLRSVLSVLVAEPGEPLEFESESHLAPRLQADPVGRRLVRRIVDDWLARL